ncbi:VOC family protein [Oceanobacillus salinisoli]|uniref:VOC family protein n=1 Tax=Oceanobacillus salinisoli TaxID=2678611 RepID=UPI0018CC4ADF|nr:VOC family protein [Oceanobacillus salinisoli]
MLALDHIVIATRDPKQAAEDFANEHAVQTIKGGKHENWGTYNYLAYFSNNSYIEWLGIFDEETAKISDNPLIQQLVASFEDNKEGMIQFALRTHFMDDFVDYYNDQRFSYKGPIPGKRIKPDGTLLEWCMLFPSTTSNLPFIIEWGNGKNIPDDKNLINTKKIISIHTLGKDVLEKVYQLNFSNNYASLENSSLKISDTLTFKIT